MLQRAPNSAFAPNSVVLPGGTVDPADHEVDLSTVVAGTGLAGVDGKLFCRSVQEVRHRVGFVGAAIRELLEETGILIGAGPDGRDLTTHDSARVSAIRAMVLTGSTLATALAAHGLVPAPSALTFCARFVTPHHYTRRFDACYFAARAPEDQEPSWNVAEASGGGWNEPAALLDRRTTAVAMLPPMRVFCATLAQQSSVAAAIAELGAHPLDYGSS